MDLGATMELGDGRGSQLEEEDTPYVGDITTECKQPRRGRFTLNYIEAHEDSEDGALL